jgi:hypothetical protein
MVNIINQIIKNVKFLHAKCLLTFGKLQKKSENIDKFQ